MSDTPEDIALNTLVDVAKEHYPELSLSLVKRLYDLQKTHQFEADRTASIQALQRVLEAEIDAKGVTQ